MCLASLCGVAASVYVHSVVGVNAYCRSLGTSLKYEDYTVSTLAGTELENVPGVQKHMQLWWSTQCFCLVELLFTLELGQQIVKCLFVCAGVETSAWASGRLAIGHD